MTTPQVRTIKRAGSRFYVHPSTRSKVPGVTSVVGMLPKPFLKRWGERVVAEFATANVGTVVQMALAGQFEEAVAYLKGAPYRDTKAAGETGDAVHSIIEQIVNGEEPRVHPDYEPYVNHFRLFVERFQPEFLHVEPTIWSYEHGYAGSTDAIMRIDGTTVMGDWKTTRSGIHEDVAVQMCAYSRGDVLLDADGNELPMPEIEGAIAIWLRPEQWHVVPARIDDEVFEVFLALRTVFEWDTDLKHNVLGKPLTSLE